MDSGQILIIHRTSIIKDSLNTIRLIPNSLNIIRLILNSLNTTQPIPNNLNLIQLILLSNLSMQFLIKYPKNFLTKLRNPTEFRPNYFKKERQEFYLNSLNMTEAIYSNTSMILINILYMNLFILNQTIVVQPAKPAHQLNLILLQDQLDLFIQSL